MIPVKRPWKPEPFKIDWKMLPDFWIKHVKRMNKIKKIFNDKFE